MRPCLRLEWFLCNFPNGIHQAWMWLEAVLLRAGGLQIWNLYVSLDTCSTAQPKICTTFSAG